jgi:hypothetical protein
MTLTITQAFLLPLMLGLMLVLLQWAASQLRESKPLRKAARNRIYRCQVCEHVYLDARDVPLARCDRCGCLNEAVKT